MSVKTVFEKLYCKEEFGRFFVFYLFIYLTVPGLSYNTGDLVPWPVIEPGLPALGVWSLTHWTTREVLGVNFKSSPFHTWNSPMWIIWSHLSKNICSFIYNLDLRGRKIEANIQRGRRKQSKCSRGKGSIPNLCSLLAYLTHPALTQFDSRDVPVIGFCFVSTQTGGGLRVCLRFHSVLLWLS